MSTTVHHSQHKNFEYCVVRIDNSDSQLKNNTETSRSSLVDKLMRRTSKSSSCRGSESQGRRYITPILRNPPRSTATTPTLAAAAVDGPVNATSSNAEKEGGATVLEELEADLEIQHHNMSSVMDHIVQKEKRGSVMSQIIARNSHDKKVEDVEDPADFLKEEEVASAPPAKEMVEVMDETAALQRLTAAFEAGDEEVGRTVLCCGLTWGAGVDELHKFFKECGTITKCTLITRNGLASGNAFVTFESVAGAARAVQLDGESLSGRWMKVLLVNPPKADCGAPPSKEAEGSHTVFVGNFAGSVNAEILTNFFSDCGAVSSIDLATDRQTGDFLGFGHVEFVETDATDKAVAKAGSDLLGQPICVGYAEDNNK